MNHKYGRKKDSRAGCLMCKPYKANAVVGQDRQLGKRELPENVKVSNGRFYDWCPDCNGTGRCNCLDCKGKTCLLCGGSRIYEFNRPRAG